jgi:hypothetical protein
MFLIHYFIVLTIHIPAFMFLQFPSYFIKPSPEFAWGCKGSVVGIMTTLQAGRYWLKSWQEKDKCITKEK